MTYREEMWRFQTKHFAVVATIEEDYDLDLSWDEDGETRQKLESGEYQSFGTVVTVYANGVKVGEDSLWGSIYENPKDFFSGHRDANPLNRNSSIMRAANGANTVMCHYFPSMVREAIKDARATLAKLPQLKTA